MKLNEKDVSGSVMQWLLEMCMNENVFLLKDCSLMDLIAQQNQTHIWTRYKAM